MTSTLHPMGSTCLSLNPDGTHGSAPEPYRTPPAIKPHDWLRYYSCDTIAECMDGVSPELYQALWGAMSHAKPLGDQIDIEESSPCDAIGINTPVEFWHLFTDDEKAALNAIAAEAEG